MKLSRKLNMVNPYDIAEFQSYLSDMAAEGLILREIGGFFGHYEKAAPQKITYRLEPLMYKENRPQEEKIEHYREFGWEYVTNKYPFHIYSSTREEPVEIHSDPVTHGYTYDYLHKEIEREFKGIIIFIFVVIILSLTILTPTLFEFITDGISFAVMMSVFVLYGSWQVFSNRIRINKLIATLQSGSPITHKKKYKKSFIHSNPTFNFLFVFLICNILTRLSPIGNLNTEVIESYQGAVPSILLTQIENDDINYEYEFSSQISHAWTELASDIYYVKEFGVVAGKEWDSTTHIYNMETNKWEDSTNPYSPSLESEYYKLRFSFLAEPLFDELIEAELKAAENTSFSYNAVSDTSFDRAVTIETENKQILIATVDDIVIHVTYEGKEELFLYIDEIYKAASLTDSPGSEWDGSQQGISK